MRNNLIVLGVALVAIAISSFTKCERIKMSKQQMEEQEVYTDSLQCVLDSLSNVQPDTVIEVQTLYKTKTVTKVDTVMEEFEKQVLSTSFIEDDVEISMEVTVQNSMVLDFQYDIYNQRDPVNIYSDTVIVVKHEVIYDTVLVEETLPYGQPIYKPRRFNGGFAIVSDPTLAKIAPGLSLSYDQHELTAYYNVLDKETPEKFGFMYRFNLWKNYTIQNEVKESN